MELLSPYPGLRPFEVDESHLFFGRDNQTDELLQRLHATRFLAVVGPSGCGKSSLVRAGMIAALRGGFMVAAGARWQFAIMRPESCPMQSLAKALVDQTGVASQETEKDIATGFLAATLRRGPLGIVEALRDTPLPPATNLLILVDQFEEIFRFEREGGRDEADAFVSLLLATARQREVPVFVVITMRSDFLGDCATFEGLPEALNESQYLTPRLTREQRRDAMVGPARVFEGDVAPDLVSRLLNQMGTDPDQLPLMQHLLTRMWTWRFAPRDGALLVAAEPEPSSESAGRVLTLADYEAVGGLSNALSRHADEAFVELDERQKAIAETLFRRLSERAPGNRDIRRPTVAGEVAELAGASLDELIAVAEHFRAPGRSFIVPPYPEPIEPNRVLDVTHESLIRQWERLRNWAEQEENSAEIYRLLAQNASLWRHGQSALYQSPNLDVALDWRTREQPTALWAKRYGDDFGLAMEFLAESEKARAAREAEGAAKRRAEIRLWRITTASVSALSLLMLAFGGYWYKYYIENFAERVTYYNSATKRFGEPVGIGELTPDQVHHRALSFKFMQRGRRNPALWMEAVNADGDCTPDNYVGTYVQTKEEEDGNSPQHECHWEFVYDHKGQVVYEKAYDKDGHQRWGYSYTPIDQQRKSRTALYFNGQGLPARFKDSSVEVVRIDYSDNGFEKGRSYTDREGNPRPGLWGAYGLSLEFDQRGVPITVKSLDQDGSIMIDREGKAIRVMVPDAFGNALEVKYFDQDERPIVVTDGWHTRKAEYDVNGNLIYEAFFDTSGYPTVNRIGYHLARANYDERGHPREIGLYDNEGASLVTHPKILEVQAQSSAENLGLCNGDVIVAYDDKLVFSEMELIEAMGSLGDRLRRIDIIRDGRHLVFEAPPGRLGVRLGRTLTRSDQPKSANVSR
jgi:hypothetical protein